MVRFTSIITIASHIAPQSMPAHLEIRFLEAAKHILEQPERVDTGKIVTLQRAFAALEVAADHLYALENLTDVEILERARKQSDDIQALVRYLIRDILLKPSSSPSPQPIETQSQQVP
jgi:hypothetical protein